MIVSFYTQNTSYEEEASYLKASCEKIGIPHEIDGIDSLGSWEENCCYKATFILEKLQKHQTPLLWIDADAMLLQKPTLLDTIEEDVAVHVFPERSKEDPSYLASGTLFLKPTSYVFNLIERWIQACTKTTSILKDQDALNAVIDPDRTFFLPRSYYTVYDTIDNQTLTQDTVVLHYQASRVLKHEIEDIASTAYLDHIQNEERTARYLHRLSTLHQLGIHAC